ncbi:MAG: M20/M25/M40 family metallo-hydrolase, partial [Oscillospiraceae bacterium]|nr:M20/M25/M40 family metallo-hydrolase [Oscillospiraceae bacterium]
MPWWWMLIRVSGAAAGAVVLVYAVLLLRATRSRRARTKLDPAFELDAESAKHAAESLSALIRFRTVSHRNPAENESNEWVKLRDYLRKRYPGVHNTLTREVVGDYSLLYRWEAPEPAGDPILLCGHLDVVPAEGEWEHPPFAGAVHDGYIWGRGALDCKNVVIAIFEAVEALINRGVAPSRDVYMAIGHDHETGGRHGAASMARLFAERDLRFHMALDEGCWLSRGTLPLRLPVAQVAVAEKGHMTVALNVTVPGGHASVPPAHTAAGLLAEAVARI